MAVVAVVPGVVVVLFVSDLVVVVDCSRCGSCGCCGCCGVMIHVPSQYIYYCVVLSCEVYCVIV